MEFLQKSSFASLWAAVIVLTFACLMMSCDGPGDEMAPDNNQDQMSDDETGEAAPGFELEALDGGNIKLSDYNDKVVVLFFLGHSCPSCKAVAASVEKELNTDYAGKTNYAILGLDTWDGNNSSMQSFKDVTGITFPLLLKASGVAKDYNTTYDRFVVINKSGNIVHNGTRLATNDLATVKSKVDELLADM